MTDTGVPQGTFTERLLYRGNQVGQVVVSGSETFTETFLYRPDGSPLELLYQLAGQPTVRFWYALDGRGSVVALTNAAGQVVDSYAYDLWGALLNTGGAAQVLEGVPQPLRYHGYWYDGWYDGASFWQSGHTQYASNDDRPLPWYSLGARTYDPVLERFLQPDPSARDGVRSYAYAQDDPVNRADPSGLASDPLGPLEEFPPLEGVGGPTGPEVAGGSQGGAVTSAEGVAGAETTDASTVADTGIVDSNHLTFDQHVERYGDTLESRPNFGEEFATADAPLKRILGGRSKYLYRFLPKNVRKLLSIGVERLNIDGQETEAVLLYNNNRWSIPDDVIAHFQTKVEQLGARFVLTNPGEHVEVAGYRVELSPYS